MDSFFTRHASATWPQQRRLHVYALGNDALRRTFTAYHQALRESGVAATNGLGLQPPEWAHVTTQMTLRSLEELDDEQVVALVERLRAAVAGLRPLTLQVGAAKGASLHAVELAIEPSVDVRWRETVMVVRTAIAEVLGADALPELGPNVIPHTSIGYGTGPGDSGAITSVLNPVRVPTVHVPVTALHLVAVTQHPADGYFTWEPVAELPLGGHH